MNKREIEKTQLKKILENKKRREENFRAKILLLRAENKEFKELDDKLRKATITNENIKKLKELHSEFLKKNKIEFEKPCCAVCGDSGYVNGKKCFCLKSAIYNALINQSGISTLQLKSFDSCNLNVFENEFRKTAEKIYSYFKKLADNFNITDKSNFLVTGKSGAGKTFLFSAIAGELLKREISVLFITAFSLNNLFARFHTASVPERKTILEPVLDCDALLIDDLGTEIIYENITEPYLLMLLKERLLSGKKTFVNTNFNLEQILDHYGERIFSRLADKANSVVINFENTNLRI